MKRFTIFALIVAIAIAFTAQAQDAIFKKYASEDGVTLVNISKNMLRLMPKLKTGNKKVKEAANKLDHIRVLSCDKKKTAGKIKKDVLNYFKKNNYEEVVSTREGKELVQILQRDLGGGKFEYVILNTTQNEINLVNITGALTLDEARELDF
ncbi:MAG: DUF4252 domain-containing protein [Muribaculaceae bacterium]|nr:DUF4252 domain-containing protein [Muribaculaceae bacterium]MBQ4008694.1 DUF4252 domain-containing protein [Muribaculaceae bacterium]